MDESSTVGPRTNIALSVGILVACGLGWLATNALPTGLRVDPLGPAYYPRFVLLGTAALALALLVASVRDLRRALSATGESSPIEEPAPCELPSPSEARLRPALSQGERGPRPPLPLGEGGGEGTPAVDEEALPPVSYPRMLAVLGLTFAYVLLLERLGYFISTLLYVGALLLLLRVRNPLAIGGCALGVPLVLDALFGRLLGIPLPGGLLDQLTFLP